MVQRQNVHKIRYVSYSDKQCNSHNGIRELAKPSKGAKCHRIRESPNLISTVTHSHSLISFCHSGEANESASAIPTLEDPFNDLKVEDENEVSNKVSLFLIYQMVIRTISCK